MLEKVKLALRITTNAFDSELDDLILSAIEDLKMSGVIVPEYDVMPPIIQRAIVTYCKYHFGECDNPEKYKTSYDEQKAQLGTATGYTQWTEAHPSN